MGCRWDEITLEYAQEGKVYCCFPVAKTLVHKVMNRVIEEQRNGILKGWSFEENLIEILQDEGTITNCYY
jgi:hypothetical protein